MAEGTRGRFAFALAFFLLVVGIAASFGSWLAHDEATGCLARGPSCTGPNASDVQTTANVTFGLIWLFAIVALGGLALGIFALRVAFMQGRAESTRPASKPAAPDVAHSELRMRFARGEITEEEYRARERVLRGS
jgi:uncharacterized membrane protein